MDYFLCQLLRHHQETANAALSHGVSVQRAPAPAVCVHSCSLDNNTASVTATAHGPR